MALPVSLDRRVQGLLLVAALWDLPLKSILSNENIFGIDLYKAGIGERIEEMFLEEIAGKGAVRATLKKYMA